MSASILLIAKAEGDFSRQAIVLAALVLVMVITGGLLLAAPRVYRILGVTGMHVVNRIFGVLLSALAVQFVLDGLNQSNLMG